MVLACWRLAAGLETCSVMLPENSIACPDVGVLLLSVLSAPTRLDIWPLVPVPASVDVLATAVVEEIVTPPMTCVVGVGTGDPLPALPRLACKPYPYSPVVVALSADPA